MNALAGSSRMGNLLIGEVDAGSQKAAIKAPSSDFKKMALYDETPLEWKTN